MTAEIVIMNKTAVALAADSAVTAQVGKGEKIFNTANKLFTLSKYQPVGVMVFGNTEIMGVPWETIIKLYRKYLGAKVFASLFEYAEDFLGFVAGNKLLFPRAKQKEYFSRCIESYFLLLKKQIDDRVTEWIKENGKITAQKLQDIVAMTVREHHQQTKKRDALPCMPKSWSRSIPTALRDDIIRAQKKVFQKLPIDSATSRRLKRIGVDIFCRGIFPLGGTSGVVVAGFGERDVFPGMIAFTVECVVCDRLKRERIAKLKIGDETTAAIRPFAQSEMVHTFMQGIDPGYRGVVQSYMGELVKKYRTVIVNAMSKDLSEKERTDLRERLKDVGQTILLDMPVVMEEYSRQKYADPVMNAISLLPKDELAAVAESLVNLTSFKRKVSMDAETVGGPIDVAVISKGDGFIWIKRKHYFKPELNPHFSAKYFRGPERR